MARRRMHLMGYVVAGPTWHHNGSWRHARSDVPDLLDASRYEHIARVLELGKFDGLFFVDTLALVEFYNGSFDAVVRNGGQIFMMEPTQLLAAMARVTRNWGWRRRCRPGSIRRFISRGRLPRWTTSARGARGGTL